MSVKREWDIYEEAILICYYINLKEGLITNEDAKSELSKRLRIKTLKQCIIIDETFRNENGMVMKLANIMFLFTEGKKGLSAYSKLDKEVYELYKTDYSRYLEILKKGLEMSDLEEEIQLNFNQQDDCAYTAPTRCILFNKELPRAYTGWSSLYVQILKEFRKLYPEIVKANTFLTENKLRNDLVDELKIYQLTRYVEIDTNLYAEINYSAKDFIIRIANLLKLCGLNNDDLLIYYVKKQIEKTNITQKQKIDENSTLYIRLKSMANVYDDVNGFSTEWILSKLGLDITIEELKTVLDNIPWITKVRTDVYSFSKKIQSTIDFDKETFVHILMLRYQSGIQFDSIDLDNFKETYKEITGKNIELTDKELENCIKLSGILYKGRVFPADGLISSDIKTKLLNYIDEKFNNGKKVLYYKAIYTDLAEDFSSCYNLSDENMLKAYLEYTLDTKEFFFFEDYLAKEKNVSVNDSAEIEEFLFNAGRPLSYKEIYSGLSHISKDIINNEIKCNSNIVFNEKEHYFHYDIFEMSTKDADIISQFINEEIQNDGYCIWSHIYKLIKEKMPLFIETNVYLSSIGIRNAISKKLNNQFTFNGEVISNFNQSLNMADVYHFYGEHHTPFSDNDLYNFSREANGGLIYFYALSETTVRVSKNLFISRKQITFDIDSVDNAISTYISDDYILIKEIDSFLIFPNVGYEWNEFLLESYLMYFSKKFNLVNNGRSLNNVAGAVVKKGKGFDDFINVCADILAKSNFALTINKSLDYLVEKNLLTRKSYSKIEEAITIAKQLRNKRG